MKWEIPMARRDVSEGRKTLYYLGLILVVLGFLSFGSVFVTGALNFGNFNNFDAQVRSSGIRAVAGMAMMIIGSIISGIGRLGPAGSGVILDPKRAREDLEPWSRMAGGVVKDVLDESGIELGRCPETTPENNFAAKLRELHALREEGILTEEEYQREKAEILDRN